ncbi:MAG: UDP-N-acetylmuramoyl-tripeptide--D-alanyl-D-alanine ligase [Candidatus Bipolaricaulia bacterium]
MSALWIPIIIIGLIWRIRFFREIVRFLHILQLEGYDHHRLQSWIQADRGRLPPRAERYAIVGLLLIGAAPYLIKVENFEPFFLTLPAIALTIELYLLVRPRRPKPKKRLVYTARAIRLLVVTFILAFISLAAGLRNLPLSSGSIEIFYLPTARFIVLTLLWNQLAPFALVTANLLLRPVEETIQRAYLRSARRKLHKLRPKVIGITGSYGKTSTKYILESVLSGAYRVLKTPESYNTPMGICRAIREYLSPEHEIFIVEMGAYGRGEVAALCDLVGPEIGILTAIGSQHLERFKDLETITETKYELIASLPEGGLAVFNADDPRCAKSADRTEIKGRLRVVRYGIEPSDDPNHLTLSAREIEFDGTGTTFTVESRETGETARFHTPLLGQANVSNILAATAVAVAYGVGLAEVGRTVETLQPIPHRLQPIAGAGGVTVIDDAYNANPVGARIALELLSQFPAGRKVLVTPGLIELGPLEAEENRRLGAEAARVCDYVILVGPERTFPIWEGLQAADFPTERTIVVHDLDEATEQLKEILTPGDVVLFENDLPDNYL